MLDTQNKHNVWQCFYPQTHIESFRCVCFVANWFWWLFNATINPHSRHIHRTRNMKFYGRGSRAFCVDESVINSPDSSRFHGFASSKIFRKLENISFELDFVGCTFASTLERTAMLCCTCMMLAVRIYYRQFERMKPVCNIIDIGAKRS
jgi:hypothetical protein